MVKCIQLKWGTSVLSVHRLGTFQKWNHELVVSWKVWPFTLRHCFSIDEFSSHFDLKNMIKVEMTNEWTLKCSGQAKFKGKALLFLVSQQNLNVFFGIVDALKIIKDILEMRRLQAPKVLRVKKSKKQTTNTINPVPKHAKHSCMLLYCYSSKIICRIEGNSPITL